MKERVLEIAMALGKREESEQLSLLCDMAIEELTGRLKPSLTPEDCGAAFPVAAAWFALARLCAGEEDEVESVTAGDVTLRRREGEQRRKALEIQAVQVIKPYLRDEGFVFLGVRG